MASYMHVHDCYPAGHGPAVQVTVRRGGAAAAAGGNKRQECEHLEPGGAQQQDTVRSNGYDQRTTMYGMQQRMAATATVVVVSRLLTLQ
jgi:hypothetical protein